MLLVRHGFRMRFPRKFRVPRGSRRLPPRTTPRQPFSQPCSPAPVDDSNFLAELKAKSFFKITQTDDGGIEAKYRSSLKFTYEFQSEDGTTVKLLAKLKTRVAYEQNADGSFELKARVKLQLSMMQETVQSGLTPALDSGAMTDEAMSAVTSALQGFGGIIDRMTGQFVDGTLAGDDLIASLVDGFNQLTRSAQSILPSADAQAASLVEPTPDSSSAVASVASPPVIAVDQALPTTSSATATSETPSNHSESANVEQPTAQPAAVVTAASQEKPGQGSIEATPGLVGGQTETGTTTATSPYSARSLFMDLRVKFVQSLSSLVTILDSPPDGTGASVTNWNTTAYSRLDIRLAAYSQTQAWGETLPRLNVDAEV
jgi:hypothetical protein